MNDSAVLTVLALQLATPGSYGQNHFPRTKMVQGLFLDGIQADGRYFGVVETHQFAILILPDSAATHPSLDNLALMRAEQTLD